MHTLCWFTAAVFSQVTQKLLCMWLSADQDVTHVTCCWLRLNPSSLPTCILYLLYLHCVKLTAHSAKVKRWREKCKSKSGLHDSFASFCARICVFCVCASVLSINRWECRCTFRSTVRYLDDLLHSFIPASSLISVGLWHTDDFHTQVHSPCESFVSTYMEAQHVLIKMNLCIL